MFPNVTGKVLILSLQTAKTGKSFAKCASSIRILSRALLEPSSTPALTAALTAADSPHQSKTLPQSLQNLLPQVGHRRQCLTEGNVDSTAHYETEAEQLLLQLETTSALLQKSSKGTAFHKLLTGEAQAKFQRNPPAKQQYTQAQAETQGIVGLKGSLMLSRRSCRILLILRNKHACETAPPAPARPSTLFCQKKFNLCAKRKIESP